MRSTPAGNNKPKARLWPLNALILVKLLGEKPGLPTPGRQIALAVGLNVGILHCRAAGLSVAGRRCCCRKNHNRTKS